MTGVAFVETISTVPVAMINKRKMVAMINEHNTVAMINKHTALWFEKLLGNVSNLCLRHKKSTISIEQPQ